TDPRTEPAQHPLPGVSTTHTSWHCHHNEPASGDGQSGTFSGPSSPWIVDVPYVDDLSSLDHPTVAKVSAALSAWGDRTAAEGITVLLDEVRTASQAAAALGIDVGAIANSLVFRGVATRSDGTEEHFPLLVLTSGSHRADTTALAERTGLTRIDKAEPDFVK